MVSKTVAILGSILAIVSLVFLILGVIQQRWQLTIGSLLILGAMYFATKRIK